MKKHVADLPIDAVTRAFQMSTRDAAARAVAAGRLVAGWENGRLVEYGSDAGLSNEQPAGRKDHL